MVPKISSVRSILIDLRRAAIGHRYNNPRRRMLLLIGTYELQNSYCKDSYIHPLRPKRNTNNLAETRGGV